MRDREAAVGLFGKLPARGDFVRLGLPGVFVAAWDAWLSAVLPASQSRLGAAWLPAWLEAPVWRFALAPGLCGPGAVLGVMMPSVDRVGRYFPLTLAAVAARPAAGTPIPDSTPWLDACEAAGIAALERDIAPEAVVAAVPTPPAFAAPGCGSRWWTQGGPRVAETAFAVLDLPDADRFATMLDAAAAPA